MRRSFQIQKNVAWFKIRELESHRRTHGHNVRRSLCAGFILYKLLRRGYECDLSKSTNPFSKIRLCLSRLSASSFQPWSLLPSARLSQQPVFVFHHYKNEKKKVPLWVLSLLFFLFLVKKPTQRVAEINDAVLHALEDKLKHQLIMAIADQKSPPDNYSNGNKVWGFFKLPFRGSNANTTPSSSSLTHLHHQNNAQVEGSNAYASNSVSSVARSFLPTRRRLKLDPATKLYFPCNFFPFLFFFLVFLILFLHFGWSSLLWLLSIFHVLFSVNFVNFLLCFT